MEIRFLGTGGAWGLPEHTCPCATCRHLRSMGEHRTRTSLWLEGPARVLIDPGPDLRAQLMRENLPRPDVVLITHEHGDHFLGLDDLLCFRRASPADDWQPIPVFATAKSWEQIEPRFGYLLGSLLEKHIAEPGEPLEGACFGPGLQCVPIKTDHGPMPQGAVGYRLEMSQGGRSLRLGYTSDMVGLSDPDGFSGLDLLVCQSHFLNEPRINRANHLSLQRALGFWERWRPGRLYLVHISCQDFIPGDEPANQMLKKYAPAQALCAPDGEPYPIPRDQDSWQEVVERIFKDRGLPIPVQVAWDGLKVTL